MLYDADGLQNLTDTADFPAASPARSTTLPRIARVRPRLSQVLQLGLKRGFDFFAALGLLILFAPLLLLITLTIVLVDRMPPLYRQQRYGRNGVPFTILKFRSMTCADAGRAFTQAVPGDARITRLGALLRRTSLDELPQLANVLAGHMSLVGPRPHALVMEEEIHARYPWAASRLDMRPGMTGLAQVRGLRGPTRRKDDLNLRLDSDLEYIRGWALHRDLAILAMTPGAWLLGRNAS